MHRDIVNLSPDSPAACGEKVGMRGPLRESEPAETPPHRAEFWFSSVPRGPLPASGARNAVCPPPIPQPEKMCAQASPERGRLRQNAGAVLVLRLRQRMQVAHQALEALLQHVGIDLRGRDVGVSEQ